MQQATWLRSWKRELWPRLLSGVTLPPSTVSRGVVQWIASWQGSPVSRSLQLQEVDESRQISGPTSLESSKNAKPPSSSWRTSPKNQWNEREGILLPWDTTPLSGDLAPPQWVPRIDETVGGWLPTITVRANYFSPSMLKWPAYRRLRLLTGGKRPGPTWWEWMMGVPMEHTACVSSVMESSPRKQP